MRAPDDFPPSVTFTVGHAVLAAYVLLGRMSIKNASRSCHLLEPRSMFRAPLLRAPDDFPPSVTFTVGHAVLAVYVLLGRMSIKNASRSCHVL
jgi:hypothetical protein